LDLLLSGFLCGHTGKSVVVSHHFTIGNEGSNNLLVGWCGSHLSDAVENELINYLLKMTSKITNQLVLDCITQMRSAPTHKKVVAALVADGKMMRNDDRLAGMTAQEAAKQKIQRKDIDAKTRELGAKERKYKQTVEMQVALKDYDPQKDKRFVGSVRLP
jgi:DNA-binding protein